MEFSPALICPSPTAFSHPLAELITFILCNAVSARIYAAVGRLRRMRHAYDDSQSVPGDEEFLIRWDSICVQLGVFR